MTREQRLDYERRILAAEVETVRLARRSKRFAELIQRNTSTLDAALTVANFDADKRGYDRLVVEPWMPTLLSLLDDIAQILPEDDNQKGLLSGKQPKSVVDRVRDHLIAARHFMYDEHWLAEDIDQFLNDESVESEFLPVSDADERLASFVAALDSAEGHDAKRELWLQAIDDSQLERDLKTRFRVPVVTA